MKTRKIYVIKYFQLKVKFCTGNWLKYFLLQNLSHLFSHFIHCFISDLPDRTACLCCMNVSGGVYRDQLLQCSAPLSSCSPDSCLDFVHKRLCSLCSLVHWPGLISGQHLVASHRRHNSPVPVNELVVTVQLSDTARATLVMINPKWTIIVTLRQIFFKFCYYLLRSGISQNQE